MDKSLSESVVCYIAQELKNGTLRAGDKIPSEKKLQEQLGIGRLSLREGLARCSALGIITSSQGRNSVVSLQVNANELSQAFLPLFSQQKQQFTEDLQSVRSLIECEAVALAALKRTDSDISELERIIDEASKQDSHKLIVEKDLRFHTKIAEIADNIFLRIILEVLHAQVMWFVDESLQYPHQHQTALQWHADILESISEADSEKARATMFLHLRSCTYAYQHRHDKAN
ncbi:FadR/GntR family transcriptional regulator [Planctomycetota bacterium]